MPARAGGGGTTMSLLWILLAVLLIALIVGMWRPWTSGHTHVHEPHDHV